MTDKNTLKVQALRERLSELVGEYEEKIADIRAEVTIAVDQHKAQIEELQKSLDQAHNRLAEYEAARPQEGVDEPDVVS